MRDKSGKTSKYMGKLKLFFLKIMLQILQRQSTKHVVFWFSMNS